MRFSRWRVACVSFPILVAAAVLADPPPPQQGVVPKPAAKKPAAPPKEKAADVLGQDRHAVVIGVGDYADENFPDLPLTESDARGVYSVLTDPAIGGVPKSQATLLLGKEATTKKIRSALGALRKLPKKATVFVYFSGHGMTEAGNGYWATQDAERDDLVASAISDVELREFLGKVAAERMLVMIDACYAAATINGERSAQDVTDLLQKFTGKGHAFLSAAGDGETALEASDLKHGVFTFYLLEGLRGNADDNKDGVVVLPELTNYLDAKVADEARSRDGVQKPVVDLKGVQEPAKFRLVIDAPRLTAVKAADAESKATRQRRLEKLRELALDDKLSIQQAKEGKRLVEADRGKLSEEDRLALVEYERVLEGKLAPEKLGKALELLSSTSTPTPMPDPPKKVVVTPEPGMRKSPAGVELVLVPAGTFQMGSPDTDSDASDDEKPRRTVTITRSFWLGKYEVTKGQFAKFAATGYKTDAERDGKGGYGYDAATGKFEQKPQYTWKSPGWTPYADDHPVVNVTWNDAAAFCNWQSEQEGLTPCYRKAADSYEAVVGTGYRLPTEAEWEYACRGGTTTRFSNGDDLESVVKAGNIADGTAKQKLKELTWAIEPKDGFVFTAPVGKFTANRFGLYDMHGNVWEWCGDWYDGKSYSTGSDTDPEGPASGSIRVNRGGSWLNAASRCRSAYRIGDSPGPRFNFLGFRVAGVPSSQ